MWPLMIRNVTMKYEIRYMVDNSEFTEIVDVDTAAEAAELVKHHHPDPSENFELIQVQLLEEENGSDVDEQDATGS